MGTWMHGQCAACGNWMGGWHVAGWVLAVVVLVALVTLVVLAVTRETRGRSDVGNAAAILAERYARGEIDTEEYEQRRGQLR